MRSTYALALTSVLLVLGCGAPARRPGELRLVLEHDLVTLDPALSTDVNDGKVIALVFSTLVKYDLQGSLRPELATTWTVSPDARTYTFTLRPDARFSSGRSVVASDVRYSFERILAPATASPRAWVFERLSGAKAFSAGRTPTVTGLVLPDDHTVSLTLDRPFAPFLGFLSMPCASVVPREAVESLGKDFARSPVGSGPFRFVKWVMGNEVVLGSNPHAYGTKPRVDQVVYTVMNEPFTYATEFKVGNLDVIPLPFSEDAFFSSHPTWKDHIESRAGLNVYFLGMNCEKGPCKDPRVRRAICHALDPDLVVQTTRRGQAVRAYGPIPPGLPGHDPSFRGLAHDEARAKALLAEAGFPSGLTIDLLQDQRKENLEVTQILASSLERAGIKVNLVPLEWGIFTTRINDGAFDAFYRSWWADYADAENFLYPLLHSAQAGSGGNRPRYRDAAVDAMIEAAQGQVDDRARLEAYGAIERRVVEDAPYAFLFHKLERQVVQPWVHGWRLFPVFNAAKLDDVWLDEAALGKR